MAPKKEIANFLPPRERSLYWFCNSTQSDKNVDGVNCQPFDIKIVYSFRKTCMENLTVFSEITNDFENLLTITYTFRFLSNQNKLSIKNSLVTGYLLILSGE